MFYCVRVYSYSYSDKEKMVETVEGSLALAIRSYDASLYIPISVAVLVL